MKPKDQIHEELWAFPCEHAIKVMGYSDQPLVEIICKTLSDEAIEYCKVSIKVKQSQKGKYSSITVKTMFKEKKEVESLYSKLASRKEIVWTL